MSPHGVLIVDKPTGPTSHDVVARARRVFKTRAVGHAGTLDPLASGVLLVLVGEATKLSSWLTLASKRYQTRMRLGAESDTLDAQGTLREVRYAQPTEEQVSAALAEEKLRTSQVPPSVSAIKVDGQRAYDLTRKGEAPELPPRNVSVQELELLSADERELELRLTVSKGYYVRALARDLAQRLDTAGYLTELRRLASGPFGIEEAVGWPPEEPPALLSVSEAARRSLPVAELNEEGNARAACGKRLDGTCFTSPPPLHPETPSAGEPPVAWYHASRLVALGRAEGELFRVVRGFNPELCGELSSPLALPG
ncbi:MAG: tRNA pseudouridine(55) synthase TruB [Polyangiaceae bacterium]|nr:tRNA pseudouridine(55) synthase TruB [Polyangiaceae bacterium]